MTKKKVEALTEIVHGQAKEIAKLENQVFELWLELNRLTHRVKELEDDGK